MIYKRYLALGLAALSGAAATQAAERPNVVIVVADDLGWGDVGYHGSVINTPNIDRLAERGIRMERFYSAPISSPARAGLLTGRYPSRFGFRRVVIPPWRDSGLDEGEQTIADMACRNGYTNRAAIGKWHLGHTYKVHYPLNRGFSHFYGCLNGAIDYFDHTREGELDWHNDWESSYDKGYSTDLIANEASRCIDSYAAQQEPFMLYVTFNAPHSPYQAPMDAIEEYISKEEFASLPKKERDAYTYRAMVSRMDKGIGMIMEALKRNGCDQNTIVLFMSDNGGVAGLQGGSTNAPLRGHKFQEWDGGVRVPAILYWGEGFKNGREMNQAVSFVDIKPTLAQIMGDKATADQRPYDGESILSLLTEEQQTLERYIYLGCGAVVDNDWKYIDSSQSKESMNLTEDWLTDYSTDPYEKKNAAKKHALIVKQMSAFATKYDTIRPYTPETDFNLGKQGFKAPKEWKVEK